MWGTSHPPTGKNCEKNELSDGANGGKAVYGEVAGSESEMDSHVIPGTSKTPLQSSAQGLQDEIQKKILDQLQMVNRRLDKVEDRMAQKSQGDKEQRFKDSDKKLSKLSKRHFARLSDSSQSSSDPSEEEQCIPTLNEIRKSAKIQKQVDKRIRELEQQSEMASTLGKVKSKRGGSVV